MSIKELLNLVKIYELSAGRYSRNVQDLYLDTRYGSFRTTSSRAPLELGRALLTSTDFCRTVAGLADDHRVMLPVGNLLRSRSAIADRLQFMLYAPRNESVISSLLDCLIALEEYKDPAFEDSKRKKRRASKGRSSLAKVDIDELARRIGDLATSCPAAARGLMRGDLERAMRLAQDMTSDEDRREAAAVIREMALIWGLFDLQIIAARLFHCEHGSYANGSPDSPQPALTTESVSKTVRTLHRAGCAASLLRNAKLGKKLTSSQQKELVWFDKFLEENDLSHLAHREGQELGFTRAQLEGHAGADPQREAQLVLYLAKSKSVAGKIKRVFAMMEKSKGLTFARAADTFYAAGRAKQGTSAVRPKVVSEWHLEATTHRYGVGTISALTFAVLSTVVTVSRLPHGDALLSHDFKAAQGPDMSSRTHAETRAIRSLIWFYRNIIVRDPNHFVHGFHLDDYARLQKEAEEDGYYDVLEPAPLGEPTRMDWVMGKGLLPHHKIEAYETAHGSDLKSQQARSPAEGLREALALGRCIEDQARKLAAPHRMRVSFFQRSFSSSLSMRFAVPNRRAEWNRNLWANPTNPAP